MKCLYLFLLGLPLLLGGCSMLPEQLRPGSDEEERPLTILVLQDVGHVLTREWLLAAFPNVSVLSCKC